METVREPAPEVERVRPTRRWPYIVGLVVLVLAVAALVYAPFGAIVYMALPGIALAAWFGFADRSPARIGLGLSLGAFLAGLVIGVGILWFAGPGPGAGDGGWTYAFAVVALWLLPIIGLLIGICLLYTSDAADE